MPRATPLRRACACGSSRRAAELRALSSLGSRPGRIAPRGRSGSVRVAARRVAPGDFAPPWSLMVVLRPLATTVDVLGALPLTRAEPGEPWHGQAAHSPLDAIELGRDPQQRAAL